MRTELKKSNQENSPGYGAGSGDYERYEYECLCGNGSIIETHDNIPGFRDHDVYLNCKVCNEIYRIDTSQGGVRGWEIVKK